MSAVVLETKNLSHIYSEGTTSRVDAIRDICLKIEKGELVGVIGHTGSGKSTLIQHFNGLLKGSSGVVMLEGKDIWQAVNFANALAAISVQRLGTTPSIPWREEILDFMKNN